MTGGHRPSRRTVVLGAANLAATVTALNLTAAASLGRQVGEAAVDIIRDAALGPVTVYGAPGSFGAMSGADGVTTVGVPSWGFGPGAAAYNSAVAADGTVFVATTPFSDNQAKLTGTDMELAVFEPEPRQFTRLVIPSTAGRSGPPVPTLHSKGIGGADVSDVVVLPAADPTTETDAVAFVSAMPYSGWEVATYGRLPTLGRLRRQGADDDWGYDAAGSRTAEALAATLPTATANTAFPAVGPGQPRSSRGANAVARLPRSGHLVIAQYFGTNQPGGNGQGALLVVDPATNQVRAFWSYPAVRVLGVPVVVNPREVVADPTSAAGDERFVLISDCWAGAGQTQPFGVQEFAYSASTGTITPRSTAARAAQDGTRMETSCFGPDGTLYVARTAANGTAAATLAVYAKAPGGERGLVTRSPAVADWPVRAWGQTNPPDALVAGTDRGGLVRSIVADPVSGAVLVAGVDGLLQIVRPSGAGRWTAGAAVDLGLNRLRAGAPHRLGFRRGSVDPARRLLWLPANQLVYSDLPWPYRPVPLNQWLYRVDLARVL